MSIIKNDYYFVEYVGWECICFSVFKLWFRLQPAFQSWYKEWIFISNWVDLNLGLKTRYLDFYKYYLELEGKDKIIKPFKKELCSSFVNWSELEISLGKYIRMVASRKQDLWR